MFLSSSHTSPIKLDTSSRKFPCPACGKKRFVRYINSDTSQYLPEHYGRCDREESCGYFQKPEYGNSSQNIFFPKNRAIYRKPKPENTVPPIDKSYLLKTLKNYPSQTLFQFFENTFGASWATRLAEKYFLGSAKNQKTIFWYIDYRRQIRTGKVMAYLPTGRRDKALNSTWVHALLKKPKPAIPLFGEHLLFDYPKGRTVAIVESEKTALIASYFLRDTVWLASGGESLLNIEKFQILKGYSIVLFPDFAPSARERWSKIAQQANQKYGISCHVSNLYSEITDGRDLADFLIKQPIDKEFGNILNEHGYPAMWD